MINFLIVAAAIFVIVRLVSRFDRKAAAPPRPRPRTVRTAGWRCRWPPPSAGIAHRRWPPDAPGSPGTSLGFGGRPLVAGALVTSRPFTRFPRRDVAWPSPVPPSSWPRRPSSSWACPGAPRRRPRTPRRRHSRDRSTSGWWPPRGTPT